MDTFSFLNNLSSEAINELYENYKKNRDSVESSWHMFFSGFDFAQTNYKESIDNFTSKEFKVITLINAYRERGHLFTLTNPVRTRRYYLPNLDIENFGLSPSDLDVRFEAATEIGLPKSSLKDIISYLQNTYCRSFAIEYMYIRKPEIVQWLKEFMEPSQNNLSFSSEEQKNIYKSLYKAVSFEKFIHKKFPGQKRFSLEGAEALIPALDAIISYGSEKGIKEFTMGMAHRGRLNVLANILKKPYSDIFSEFESKLYDDETLLGDVKYHLGYTHEAITKKGKNIKISLCPNPSHLEAVSGVVQGLSRIKIENNHNNNPLALLPILIHGDASIAGQGIVYEIIQMSGLKGYSTGGTIHIVINNQIGFTTNYLDARTSTYCTDVAKTIQAPIMHVNGDDVEAVVYAMQLAIEYRQIFKNDVFIDLLCYRKYGHNEGDEPRFTQPILYKIIESHPNPADIYLEKISKNPDFNSKDIKEIEQNITATFENCLIRSKDYETGNISNFLHQTWSDFNNKYNDYQINTSIDRLTIDALAKTLFSIPENYKLFHKSEKLLQNRLKMVLEDNKMDWGTVENLAYASLLKDGYNVRISGQDCERGTFSHRHAVFTIDNSEEKYIPLQKMASEKAKFHIYNSLLSEYGVLGFEYGYAMGSPNSLTIWEAQFGDFSNVAQVIFDQFIFSAEEKWRLLNGLVIYLPHGYEGQGPEHSSCRIERILNHCVDNNIQVANLTTPANIFHILRRQMLRKFRKPLIICTPKSLLRHPDCVSTIEDLSNKGFERVIFDVRPSKDIDTLILCSGKIYFELKDYKTKNNTNNFAIARIEELYPFPNDIIEEYLHNLTFLKECMWVQEEPENMGAWPFIFNNLQDKSLRLISRPASASPATGSNKFHVLQQHKIIEKAFNACNCENACKDCKILCVTKLMQTTHN